MRVVRQSSFKAVPWKNGGGVTHEALRLPESGDAFRVRVSVARVEASGPFSDFTGFRRTMVLLRGRGVSLTFAGGDECSLRRVGESVQFDGAASVMCELLDGPCVDLNLMTANTLGAVEARVEHADGPIALPADGARSRLVFPINAAFEVRAKGEGGTLLENWDLGILERGTVDLEIVPREPGGLVFLAAIPA
jgi:uncharacterized protein